MTAKADSIAIESRFATMFTVCSAKYANVKFTPTNRVAWADINVVIADSMNAEVGAGRHRNIGIISVNIYEPINTGTAAGKLKADQAAAVFRDQQFSGITCRSPKIIQVGEVDEWYVINMSVPFYRDETY
jgi:hypothetical protein